MKNIRIHLIVLCLLIGEPVAQGLHMIGSISDQSLLSPKQNRTAIFSIKKKKNLPRNTVEYCLYPPYNSIAV